MCCFAPLICLALLALVAGAVSVSAESAAASDELTSFWRELHSKNQECLDHLVQITLEVILSEIYLTRALKSCAAKYTVQCGKDILVSLKTIASTSDVIRQLFVDQCGGNLGPERALSLIDNIENFSAKIYLAVTNTTCTSENCHVNTSALDAAQVNIANLYADIVRAVNDCTDTDNPSNATS
jgi:hypothetical protein